MFTGIVVMLSYFTKDKYVYSETKLLSVLALAPLGPFLLFPLPHSTNTSLFPSLVRYRSLGVCDRGERRKVLRGPKAKTNLTVWFPCGIVL